MPSSYWAAMENRKTKLINLSMGPTNAFEEQIQWTEQGRMWPYPIDNEYLIGEEENVSRIEQFDRCNPFLGSFHGAHLSRPLPVLQAYSSAKNWTDCSFHGTGLHRSF